MGAIAEAFAAFAQPLLDQTDGSIEEMNKALSIAQLCYNLALLPEGSREEMIQGMRQSLAMDAAEFDAFRNSVVEPMIRRHEEMFPRMHRLSSTLPMEGRPSRQAQPIPEMPAKKAALSPTLRAMPLQQRQKIQVLLRPEGTLILTWARASRLPCTPTAFRPLA